MSKWPAVCHQNLEETVATFKEALPDWWYSVGECQVSCDASCGPTRLSDDIKLVPLDSRFNEGFHADLEQPSSVAEALRQVMQEAIEAKEAVCAAS